MRKVLLKTTRLSRIPVQARAAAEGMGEKRVEFLAQFQKQLSYAEQFTLLLESASTQGKTIADIRKALAIMQKIDGAVAAMRDYVLLEDDEYAALRAQVDDSRWTVIDPAIVEMVDDLVNAATVDPNKEA